MFQSAPKTRRLDSALKKRQAIVVLDKLPENSGFKPKNMVNKIPDQGFERVLRIHLDSPKLRLNGLSRCGSDFER
jgi:hypothetical protein